MVVIRRLLNRQNKWIADVDVGERDSCRGQALCQEPKSSQRCSRLPAPTARMAFATKRSIRLGWEAPTPQATTPPPRVASQRLALPKPQGWAAFGDTASRRRS